jgi:hypothetical protein
MSTGAKVTSIDALDAFRAALLVYVDKASRVLEDARQQMVGTRIWLQTDRQLHWKNLIRRRTAELTQAEQELLTARLSGDPGAIQDRRTIVQQAKRTLQEAEAGLSRVHHWLRHYESEVEAHAKALPQLGRFLSHDLRQAADFLERAAETLNDYAQLATTPPPPPGSSTPMTDAAKPAPALATAPRTQEGGPQ